MNGKDSVTKAATLRSVKTFLEQAAPDHFEQVDVGFEIRSTYRPKRPGKQPRVVCRVFCKSRPDA